MSEVADLNEQLATLRVTRGASHPETLSILTALATKLLDIGHVDEAIKTQHEALDSYSKALGPDAYETIRAASRLGYMYFNAGVKDQNLSFSRQAFERSRTVFGLSSATTLSILKNLCSSLRRWKMDEELAVAQDLVIISETAIHGPDHPDTLHAISQLSHTRRRLKEFDDAYSLNCELRSRLRPGVNCNDADVIEAAVLGVTDLVKSGRWHEANELVNEVLSGSSKVIVSKGPAREALITARRNIRRELRRAS